MLLLGQRNIGQYRVNFFCMGTWFMSLANLPDVMLLCYLKIAIIKPIFKCVIRKGEILNWI